MKGNGDYSRMKFTRLALVAIAAVLIASPAFAQTPTITGVHVTIYKTSAPTVTVTTADYPANVMMCGQTPSPPITGAPVNPTTLEFTDPADATKACRVAIWPLIAQLPVLPGGDTYFSLANLTYSDASAGGTSTASNPFSRFAYQVLQGLRFIR